MADLVAVAPIERRVAEIVEPLVGGMGYVLVRLRYGGGTRKTLQIMAERPGGGMELEDCASVSKAVSAALDVEDPLGGPYALEVSSPGVDRPLTRLSDFESFRGRRARIRTSRPVDGRSRFKGVLKGVSGSGVRIETGDGVLDLPFELVASARLSLAEGLAAGGRGSPLPADGDEQLKELP